MSDFEEMITELQRRGTQVIKANRKMAIDLMAATMRKTKQAQRKRKQRKKKKEE